ncbi:MAG: hypothetical protein OXB93_01860, partial [Cytophagales bacterium]|nr:hypothetical protein [Cytophagales bacterium]
MITGNLTEQMFNAELEDAFRYLIRKWRSGGIKIEAERTDSWGTGTKTIDIRIQLPNEIGDIAVECEYDSSQYPDKDALDRFKTGEFISTIAVAVPKGFKSLTRKQIQEKLRKDSVQLKYAGFSGKKDNPKRFPEVGYLKGNVHDLADFINMTSISQDSIGLFAKEVSRVIIKNADSLSRQLTEEQREYLIELVDPKWKMEDLRVIVLLWYNALALHKKLKRNKKNQDLPDFPPDPEATHGIVSAVDMIGDWGKILKKNWISVFKPAMKSLAYASTVQTRMTANIMTNLRKIILKGQQMGVGEHVNMGGEIFQRIIAGRDETAAFYTTAPTAELLAHLTIRESDRDDWNRVDLFKALRIADLACGTGTLLRAGYLRVKQLHERRKRKSDLEEFHRNAMQEGIIGTDINRIAAHISNTSLADVGEEEPYENSQIAHVSVGRDKETGIISTGSLELLEGSFLPDLQMYDKTEAMEGRVREEKGVDVPDNSIDYVIMNPPYTKTNPKHGSFKIPGITDTEKEECQERWGILNKKFGKKYTNGGKYTPNKNAGMAASFLSIALSKVKGGGGRIGFVLPLTAAFVSSWRNTRDMIEREFEDILVITGKKGRVSDETNLNEMLLVATRPPPH